MYLWKFYKAERFYKNLHPYKNQRLTAERPVDPYGLKPDGWLLPSKTERIS
jgi:hypothetical protein